MLARASLFMAGEAKSLALLSKRAQQHKSLTIRTFSTSILEQKVQAGGVNLNYIKVGTGPHHVLCTPGALGTIWTDFKVQVEHLDRNKFTIVVWDPPGYGKSRPPKRDFSPGFYHRDADSAVKLMEALGIEKYSMLGWSNGGIVSLIAAANHPERVQKLVVWGSNTYVTQPEFERYQVARDHSFLTPELKAPYIAEYGEECYTELWEGFVDASCAVLTGSTKGDICRTLLPKITCPTLIIQGTKDWHIFPEHSGFMLKNIKNSRLHVFEGGKHHLHMQFYKEFNKLVEDFLLEEVKTSKL